MVDRLRTAREAMPFRPFTLHLADGRAYRIPTRDHVSVSPSGRTLIVFETGEAFRILDAYLLSDVGQDFPTALSAAA